MNKTNIVNRADSVPKTNSMNKISKLFWRLLLTFAAASFGLMFVVTLLLVYLVTTPFMLWYLVSDAVENIWK